MMCLIVVEVTPPQKINNIQIEVAKFCPTFTSDEKCVKYQDNFLDNQNKKARFIVGLSNHLSQNGFQCVADADTTIAKIIF